MSLNNFFYLKNEQQFKIGVEQNRLIFLISKRDKTLK